MSDDGKRRSCETELQIEAPLEETITASKGYDESTEESVSPRNISKK